MIYFWLLGLVLICLVALVLPVSLQSVSSINTYFLAALALVGLAVSHWTYLQARFAPQLRKNSQTRPAVYLLVGYLFILGIHLAWPYAFVRILAERIAGGISASELRNDLYAVENSPVSPRSSRGLQTLSLKYGHHEPLKSLSDSLFISFDLRNELCYISDVKGIVAEDCGSLLLTLRVASGIVLSLALFLRCFQNTDVESFLITLVFAVTILIALIICPPAYVDVAAGTLLSLFVASGYAALCASRLKRRSISFAVGLNIFTLLFAWTPCLLWRLIEGPLSEELRIGLFSLGVTTLITVTPWFQRRYLVLQVKPT